MDVHPAHHAPRTWREFFLQLVTITIGLFIALTLQAGVESLHHRHLVKEARENLRREIQINREHYAENVQTLEKNRRQLAHDIDKLRDLRSGKAIEKNALIWNWDWNGYIDASWKTARETGAVSYMSFDLINAYAELYLQQDYLNTQALAIINEEPKTAAFLQIAKDPSALSPSDIQSMLIGLAESDIKLATLQNLMKPLDEMYTKAMKTL
jgi:cell division protein FtsB